MNCTFENPVYRVFRSVQPRSIIVVVFDSMNVMIVVVVRSYVSNGDNFMVVCELMMCFSIMIDTIPCRTLSTFEIWVISCRCDVYNVLLCRVASVLV